jgi:putative transposase
MPRQPRLHVPGGLYHAVLRGNHRQTIFGESDDFLAFEEILAHALERYGATLHAYCWMTNHAHLAVQVDAAPLGSVMRLLASRYARRKQRPVPTTGHLFERRYRARLVDSDRYLLALVRYIHQNPIRAGIVVDAADYRWSSHCAYMGGARPAWLTMRTTLSLLAADSSEARRCYLQLMNEDAAIEDVDAIQVFAPGSRDSSDPALAGPHRQVLAPTLELIIEQVVAELGVPAALLASPSRRQLLVEARAEVARRALRAGVATLTQVAARLGRSTSTISERLKR